MERIIKMLPLILSGVLIIILMAFSGWLGYKNIGNIPSSGDTYTPDDSFSSVNTELTSSGLSPSDISLSEESVSSTDNRTASDIPESTEEKVTVKYVVINKATNIRAEDNDTSTKVAVLTKGAEVEYLSESKKRYKIRYAGSKTGWIIKSCGDLVEKESDRVFAIYGSLENEPYTYCLSTN